MIFILKLQRYIIPYKVTVLVFCTSSDELYICKTFRENIKNILIHRGNTMSMSNHGYTRGKFSENVHRVTVLFPCTLPDNA